MTDLTTLKTANVKRWDHVKLIRDFSKVAKRLVDAKQRYLMVSEKTGVPWYFIAVTHERESSQDWSRSLAQGDPWFQESTHVPAGRGPFDSWEEAAVDALVNCSPHAAKNTDWSIGGLLTMLEQYNGLGYFKRGRPSPYIWAGTNQYISGKYTSDGHFDVNAVDKQLGCAGLLKAMISLDAGIHFQSVTVPPPGALAQSQSGVEKS